MLKNTKSDNIYKKCVERAQSGRKTASWKLKYYDVADDVFVNFHLALTYSHFLANCQ